MRLSIALASIVLALLIAAPPAQAASPASMVKDINPSGSDGVGPNLLTVGEVVYFAANDGTHGSELWRSDGSAKGTYLVKDVRPGALGSDPLPLAAAGGYIYFSAKDGKYGRELWRTNGAAAGTSLVRDLTPGASGTDFGQGVAVGSRLFFGTNTALWVTDGTSAGTKSLAPSAQNMQPFNATLYFTVNGKLWRTDGTAAGTRRLVWGPPDVNTLAATSRHLFIFSGGDMLQAPGNLYRTDGTKATLKLLSPPNYEWLNEADGPVVLNDRLLFQDGPDLWRSDGTVNGTKRIGTYAAYVSDLQAVAGAAWFDVQPDEGGTQVWRTDGTKLGSAQFHAASEPRVWDGITGLGALAYWWDSSSSDWIMWASDGTSRGTLQVANLGTSLPLWMRASSSRLFFVAYDGHGFELWSYAP